MVYAYLRVSTDKQDGQNQRLGVNALAASRGLTIDEYIDDEGVSGLKEPEKRELGKLLKKLQPGDILLAGEISRLGRSLFMIFRILEYCLNNNVTIMTVKDGYTLGNDIQSKVMAFAFGLSAEIERDMISRRTKEALMMRSQNGIHIGRNYGQRSKARKVNVDEARKLLASGMKKCEIAQKIGVHRTTLYRELQMANSSGIAIQHKQTIKQHENELTAIVFGERDESVKDFAKRLGVPYQFIGNYSDDYWKNIQKQLKERDMIIRAKTGITRKADRT